MSALAKHCPKPDWHSLPSRAILRTVVALALPLCCALAHASGCFNAQHMASWQPSAAQGAVLYVWSPRMVLSALAADQVQQEARAMGLHWQPVHAAQLPDGERLAALARLAHTHPASARALQNSLALCDAPLLARDALRHFPTAFVWRSAPASSAGEAAQNGAALWAERPIVGAMPAAFWALALRERLAP